MKMQLGINAVYEIVLRFLGSLPKKINEERFYCHNSNENTTQYNLITILANSTITHPLPKGVVKKTKMSNLN